jgi:uncharacterized lipoprotein YajG
MKAKRGVEAVRASSVSAGAIGALTAMLLISGCAFTTGHVNLEYQSQTPAMRIAEADSPHVAVEVTDKRSTQIVGQKINGLGMKTADIVSDSDVPGTLKSAFETELNDRGFTVGPGGVLIAVTLSSLQNQFTVGFFSGEATANMGMDVAVKRPDGTVAYDKYITGRNQEWIELATPGNAQDTLNAAMQHAVSKVFSDSAFIDALKKR